MPLAPSACGSRWRRSASSTWSVVTSAGWAVEFDHEIGFGIDGVTLVHQARENLPGIALAQQRPVGALAHPVVQHLEVGAQPDGDGVLAHQGARLGIHVGAAAGRQHVCRPGQQARDHAAFAGAELGLAEAFEELRDRAAGRALDLVVGVDERQAEAQRQALADRALAGAHQADQGDGARH